MPPKMPAEKIDSEVELVFIARLELVVEGFRKHETVCGAKSEKAHDE